MGMPVTYSITKYGRPCGVEPASKTLAMAGWSMSASLPLGFEARDHFALFHARLDQLDRDAPANGLLLLGQPHLTHAALADQLEQTIGTDYRAGGRLTRSDRAGDELLFAVPRDCGAFVAWTVLIACSGLLNRH